MTRRPALGAPASKPTAARGQPAPENKSRTFVAPSRVGKVQLAGYFDPDAKRQLDVFAAREGRSIQSIMEEMYDDFCRKLWTPSPCVTPSSGIAGRSSPVRSSRVGEGAMDRVWNTQAHSLCILVYQRVGWP
jgi:hypothetical protein